MTDEHKNNGVVRTDMHCHDCSKNFIALLDYNIEGNHEIICPYCGHRHCRVIENGKITGDRWDGKNSHEDNVKVGTERTWQHTHLQGQTSSASHFLREKWLNIGRE